MVAWQQARRARKQGEEIVAAAGPRVLDHVVASVRVQQWCRMLMGLQLIHAQRSRSRRHRSRSGKPAKPSKKE
eukprot:2955820-Amphidinium_carterae.1